jgi:hypothetical protein
MAYANCRMLPGHQFATYDCPEPAEPGATIWAALLVQVSADGRVEDHYRLRVNGSTLLRASATAPELIAAEELASYVFHVEKRPVDLEFRQNMCCTKWEDLEQLVAAGRVHVATHDLEDADELFREDWATAKAADSTLGAALRWAVQAHPAYGFKLALQAMPATADALRKDARLSSDAASCIELASWTAATAMAVEGQWNGPVPTLFATNMQAASSNLRSHPERFSTGKTFTRLIKNIFSFA